MAWDVGGAIDDAISQVTDVLTKIIEEQMYALRAKKDVNEMASVLSNRLMWEKDIAPAMETTDIIWEMGEGGYTDYLTIFGWELVSMLDIEHEIKVFWNGG